ncbi:MAG TPA: hypothetical protein VK558_07620 [Patescibacteria group bacterium]|nr:hypothetical protein [Patescibacteria group bacterium]
MNDGIDMTQLRDQVVRPALQAIGLWSAAAEELLLGTVLQESGGGHYLHQEGTGPAVGICQMEPATHDDIWANFLAHQPDLAQMMTRLTLPGVSRLQQLGGNLYYAVAMARVLYHRISAPLPAAGDLDGQAAYYKRYYNTAGGAASTAQYLANWHRAFG